MTEQTTPKTTTTENPAGSPKVRFEADYERFELLLKGVVAVPKEEASAVEHRKRSAKKR